MNLRAPSQKLKQENPSSPIHLFTCGDYEHQSYGQFSITQEVYDSLIANFDPSGRCVVDYQHASLNDNHEEAIAAGKLVALSQTGDRLYGTPVWTERARQYIEAGEFTWISPEFCRDHVDNYGDHVGPKLLACALTARPWFECLEPVSLSQKQDRIRTAFEIEYDLPIIEIRDGQVITQKQDGRLHSVKFTTGEGDADVFFEDLIPVKREYHKKGDTMARRPKNPPKKPPKGESPYQDQFYRLSWAVVQETGKSFFDARCETKLRYPELFKAAFSSSKEGRFIGAAEWEMLSRNVPLDQGYKFAAQALPDEANFMALKGLR